MDLTQAARAFASMTRTLGPTKDEAGRVALLLAVCDAHPEDSVEFVEDLFRTGDLRERIAILHALPLLAAPERFAGVAAEAVRSNAMAVFEALACENDYPARCLNEASFNQLVVKAAFNDVALARIRGLDGRRNPELARMARALESERRAAGRPVPADLARIS